MNRSFDWLPGHRGRKLGCVAHKGHERAPVVRVTWPGHDTVLDKHKLGILTGEARRDAENLWGKESSR
jgi:hypothetical protein